VTPVRRPRGELSRREFLTVAAAGAAGAVCASCAGAAQPVVRTAAAQRVGTLRIAQFSHFVPAYDQWFDAEYTRQWGESHGVQVVVDHLPYADMPDRAAAEVVARQGHDIFHFIAPPAAFEDEVIDHGAIVRAVEARVGKMNPLLERCTFNPKTGKWFGFPEGFYAQPVHYRRDLWAATGLEPDTWEHVLEAAPRLKAAGHPLGLSLSGDADGNVNLESLMHAYGASIQDEKGNVTINAPATVEAVKMLVAIFRAGMTDEVLGWDSSSASNNRYLASGRSSMIVNTVSALRAIEAQDPALAERVALAPGPAGPAGNGTVALQGVYVVWKFARNREAAEQFLTDLALHPREAVVHSGFFNLPAFPGAVPDLGDVVAADARAVPPDKYRILADATSWSLNAGHPGYANAAVQDVWDQGLIPKMFAAAARGQMSAADAVRMADGRIQAIFDTWRARGKV
jgi:multiple sugar transport system substrate-binding protein